METELMPPRKRQAPLLEQIGLVAELSGGKDPTIRILVSKKAPSQRETVEALRIQIFNYDGAPGRFRYQVKATRCSVIGKSLLDSDIELLFRFDSQLSAFKQRF